MRPKSPDGWSAPSAGRTEIDGLLARGARLRQMREGAKRLLKVPRGFVVS